MNMIYRCPLHGRPETQQAILQLCASCTKTDVALNNLVVRARLGYCIVLLNSYNKPKWTTYKVYMVVSRLPLANSSPILGLQVHQSSSCCSLLDIGACRESQSQGSPQKKEGCKVLGRDLQYSGHIPAPLLEWCQACHFDMTWNCVWTRTIFWEEPNFLPPVPRWLDVCGHSWGLHTVESS